MISSDPPHHVHVPPGWRRIGSVWSIYFTTVTICFNIEPLGEAGNGRSDDVNSSESARKTSLRPSTEVRGVAVRQRDNEGQTDQYRKGK